MPIMKLIPGEHLIFENEELITKFCKIGNQITIIMYRARKTSQLFEFF